MEGVREIEFKEADLVFGPKLVRGSKRINLTDHGVLVAWTGRGQEGRIRLIPWHNIKAVEMQY